MGQPVSHPKPSIAECREMTLGVLRAADKRKMIELTVAWTEAVNAVDLTTNESTGALIAMLGEILAYDPCPECRRDRAVGILTLALEGAEMAAVMAKPRPRGTKVH